jgi:hypothetical protein
MINLKIKIKSILKIFSFNNKSNFNQKLRGHFLIKLKNKNLNFLIFKIKKSNLQYANP